ncbi:Uncharacterised protein [Serratia quinivorans]|nr:Uncharacterised protein [Serratia quinivorans]
MNFSLLSIVISLLWFYASNKWREGKTIKPP